MKQTLASFQILQNASSRTTDGYRRSSSQAPESWNWSCSFFAVSAHEGGADAVLVGGAAAGGLSFSASDDDTEVDEAFGDSTDGDSVTAFCRGAGRSVGALSTGAGSSATALLMATGDGPGSEAFLSLAEVPAL